MPPQPEQSTAPDAIPARLRRVVAIHLGVPPTDLRDDLDLARDLCLDSLAAAELLVVIEEDLNVKLPTDIRAGRDGVTYGDLVEFVCTHLSG